LPLSSGRIPFAQPEPLFLYGLDRQIWPVHPVFNECIPLALTHLPFGALAWREDLGSFDTLSDLLQILRKLGEIGAGFRSLTEAIDTTTAVGRMLTQVLGSFAEFEREMIRERTKLGLARARAEGRIGGKRAMLTLKQQQHALAMVDDGKSQSEVAELFGMHRSTICRLVAERRVLASW
jgi:Resolvase, N terminal domain/Homeodomain-like domain